MKSVLARLLDAVCTVDQLTNNDEKPVRSRKEILNKLFNKEKIHAFGQWKQSYLKAREEEEMLESMYC